LNPAINNNDLAQSGPAAIVSVYGTVAAEFSLLGVPVILCGDNPASAYSFAFESDTKERYFSLITNADSLRVNADIANEIYEFMYMHFLYGATLSFSEYPFGRNKRGSAYNSSSARIKDVCFADFEKMIDEAMPEISGLRLEAPFIGN
jgi:hypothetical protein